MNKTFYTIKTSYAKYHVEVWHQYPNMDKVFVGGKKRCVSMSVYLEEGEAPNIDAFGYHESCNVADNHMPGVGSRHLLVTAIRFVLDHYKLSLTTRFQLTDTSHIDCDKGYVMQLPQYYVIYHGQTWYESKFGARPMHRDPRELASQKQALSEYIKGKPDLSVYLPASSKRTKLVMDMYRGAASLEDLLGKLKTVDCIAYKGWLEPIVNRFIPGLFGMEWVIDGAIATSHAIRIQKLEERPHHWSGSGGGWVWRPQMHGIL